MELDIELQPSDLVGCRYRAVQRHLFADRAPTEATVRRIERAEAGKARVLALLPDGPRPWDPPRFHRVHVDGAGDEAEFGTLEALAAQATIITGAVFTGVSGGRRWRSTPDVLIRDTEGRYLPVIVSNHRIARPEEGRRQRVIATSRLGLGTPSTAGYRLRHHAVDGYRLGLAARALAEFGLDSGRGAAIGQDRELAFLVDTGHYQAALSTALAAPLPDRPRRLKECGECRFWFDCGPRLTAADDISLLFPGDRGEPYRQRGIGTVAELIDADLGEPSALAAAWRERIPVLRRVGRVTARRFDVEIDIDVEAYLDQGAYLWGTYDGRDYRPFVTWGGLGTTAEADTFAEFWAWLNSVRDDARARGLGFAAFCYARHGENHWLSTSARRFAGHVSPAGHRVPPEAEISAFISSDEWVDVFAAVRSQLVGPRGLGLKTVAPQAGFTWAEADLDGEASVDLYRIAAGHTDAAPDEVIEARDRLLSYNGDDCRATSVVRAWLAAGAPGTPPLMG
ncbi:TM0106 family RecB-like putative nuclease [Corynebacterium sp. P7003]|uniref:TM0106 family RecB-like putative nuclease n=1 Tax=Corynebacterium pygosceleis TaxID=2800406 RepID=A0ABT3WU71_9CORY|nr:TM0106 family RecB-like putative nuclease [Corynebacterium pygosceleis]MCX7445769.1 TM0106 family RecB-like putative nuclease [Corynebacterium pygosceleis]